MEIRSFNDWISNFRSSISSYDYYINFDKVIKNAESIKIELNILNSLIGSDDVEKDFEELAKKQMARFKEMKTESIDKKD